MCIHFCAIFILLLLSPPSSPSYQCQPQHRTRSALLFSDFVKEKNHEIQNKKHDIFSKDKDSYIQVTNILVGYYIEKEN
jgi:hypothetical protein